MIRILKVGAVCAVCGAMVGAEGFLHHRDCSAPAVCDKLDLVHLPHQEPGQGGGQNRVFTVVTSTATAAPSFSGLDQFLRLNRSS